ncbi:uncharacterized protein BJX67DRAFT_385027 [Aspergillus lucknowensis]|uniref:DUF1279 domain-containing protein n=1 Tax=Aspergillus lucknowensis TaxID=176173 RepID=A0ABR4LET2_9EURO
MSLQQPLRLWAFRTLNLNLKIAPYSSRTTTMMRTSRLTPRRPFSSQQPRFRTYNQHQQRLRSFHSTRSLPNKSGPSPYTYESPNSTPSLSQRLKTLSREYGWSALWIYLFLSALDFPFCFAGVRYLGAEKIGHYEHVVVESMKGAVEKVWPGLFAKTKEEEEEEEEVARKARAAEENESTSEGASLWTQLALAYAIHKSFIFVRVPLTAAITPKVVKQLRKWGWDVLKGKPKAR